MNIDKFLTQEELNNLYVLNYKSNIINKSLSKKKNPLNMSLNELFLNWKNINKKTVIDILSYDYTTLKKSITLIDFFNNLFLILKDIIIDKNRSIYIGVSLLLIGLIIYLIRV